MKTIIIADPAPLVLEGIQHILALFSEIQITGAYQTFGALKDGMSRSVPDLLLFDGSLAMLTGPNKDVIPPWKCWPASKTILLHTETNPAAIRRFLTEGVRSYLHKCVKPAELQKAIHCVLADEVYVQESVRQNILEQSLGLCNRKIEQLHLTKREIQIIELIVEENTTQEIAEKLFVSFNTVESHRKNLISKLGVKNSAGIVREAFRMMLYPNFHT